MNLSAKRLSIFAISIWVLVNVIQAFATPIHVDEAYYWMFSKHLDWGYFDHPPGVALLIKISDFLFNGLMGVRFMTIIAQLLTFFLIYKTIISDKLRSNNFLLKLFLVFILLPLNHIFGIITTPDVPLMLSTALFFFSLKGVLEKKDNVSYVLWMLAMAMMLYSKYHSGLVILLTLIAAPSLFKNWKTYASGAFALFLFVPHMIWQYSNDWASIMYHTSERATEFSWTYPLEYLGNILVICNPIFIFFLYKLIRKRWTGAFERVCYFVVVGFLVFFMWQSFRVRIQPQWLIVIYIPSLILMKDVTAGYELKKIRNVFLWMLPIFLAVRIMMIWDIVPFEFNIHGKKEYVEQIQKDAGERDVMFYGSYNRASIYSWYSGQEYTHSFNGTVSRKNQYNIWQLDSVYYDKEVFLVGVYSRGLYGIYYEDGKYYGNVVVYEPTDKLKMRVLKSTIEEGYIVSELELENPYDLFLNPDEKHYLAIQYYQGKKLIKRRKPLQEFQLHSDGKSKYTVRCPLPENPDVNKYAYIIRHENLPFGPAYYQYDYPPNE